MPGYDSDKFVNLSESDKSELTCSICQEILCSPVFAQCCGQSFCKDCITEWLKTNNTCPYDRKALRANDLSQPPRIMLNMLGKLRIHCDYRDKGCEEILVLENLSQHSLKCRYNRKKCEKCSLDLQTSGHDCIKALLALNQNMKQEIEALKSKGSPSAPLAQSSFQSREQSLLGEIRELKAEKENFLKTIENISNQSQTSNSPAVQSEQDLVKSARIDSMNPNIIKNELTPEMTDRVLAIIRNELRDRNNLYYICLNVSNKLNEEYGSRWLCTARLKESPFQIAVTYDAFHIRLTMGTLYFEILKIKKLDLNDFINRFRSGRIKREMTIDSTDMNESMVSYVRTITFAILQKSDWTKLVDEFKDQLKKQYGGEWLCSLYLNGHGHNNSPRSTNYIYLVIDDLHINLYKQ